VLGYERIYYYTRPVDAKRGAVRLLKRIKEGKVLCSYDQ